MNIIWDKTSCKINIYMGIVLYWHYSTRQITYNMVATVAAANATVRWVNVSLILSSIGPDSPLPQFGRGAGEGGVNGAWSPLKFGVPQPFIPPDNADAELWTETASDLRVPLLPWTAQDAYQCEQQPCNVRMLRMENADLVVDITPQCV